MLPRTSRPSIRAAYRGTREPVGLPLDVARCSYGDAIRSFPMCVAIVRAGDGPASLNFMQMPLSLLMVGQRGCGHVADAALQGVSNTDRLRRLTTAAASRRCRRPTGSPCCDTLTAASCRRENSERALSASSGRSAFWYTRASVERRDGASGASVMPGLELLDSLVGLAQLERRLLSEQLRRAVKSDGPSATAFSAHGRAESHSDRLIYSKAIWSVANRCPGACFNSFLNSSIARSGSSRSRYSANCLTRTLRLAGVLGDEFLEGRPRRLHEHDRTGNTHPGPPAGLLRGGSPAALWAEAACAALPFPSLRISTFELSLPSTANSVSNCNASPGTARPWRSAGSRRGTGRRARAPCFRRLLFRAPRASQSLPRRTTPAGTRTGPLERPTQNRSSAARPRRP